MKKNLLKLNLLSAVLLLSGVLSVNIAAQPAQPPQQPQQQPQAQQRPPQQQRGMRPFGSPLGKHYIQMPNGRKPSGDNWANPTGPYKVVMEVDPSLPLHTIYHPVDLSVFPAKDKLPIIITSGPGCNFDGDSFRPFYTEIASYGYFVIAVGLPVPEGLASAVFFNEDDEVKDAMDWAYAVNKYKVSKYFGKLDTLNLILMGQSCSGGHQTRLRDDKRITGLIYWNSGFSFLWGRPVGRSTDGTKTGTITAAEALKKMSIPIAYFVGDTDMARQAATTDFETSEKNPTFLGVLKIPGDSHAGTFREKNGGGFGIAGVSWLNWRTKGDLNAARMFIGNPGGLGKDPNWIELKGKNLD
jgi:hypothetical protein